MFKGFLVVLSLIFIAACGKGKVIKLKDGAAEQKTFTPGEGTLKSAVNIGDIFRTNLEQAGFDYKKLCLQIADDFLYFHKGPCPASGRASKETQSFKLLMKKTKPTVMAENYLLFDINEKNKVVGEVEFIQGSLNKFFLKELCQYGSTTPAPYKKACALHKQDDGFIMGYSLIKEEDKKSKLSPNLIF
jgi:hypothetical protein